MSNSRTKTNPVLILIAIVLCLVCGALLTRSSADPSPIGEESMPDIVLVKNPETQSGKNINSNTADKETVTTPSPKEERISVSPTPVPTQTSAPETPESSYTPSPEAASGVWIPSGSNWLFLVDGAAYKGWLYDTDEKVYYLDNDGIMHVGWADIDSKRYYFNLDGVMQTGTVEIDGETYQFLSDGSLEGYSLEETVSEKKEETTTEATETKSVALTFDDGPSSFTNRLLDCLEEHNAKATFFLVGYEIENFPDEVIRMNELGMEIGNHTSEHKDLTSLTADEIKIQIDTVNQQLEELIGKPSSALRPPYGAVNDTLKQTAKDPMILWSIDTLDWESLDANAIVDVVLSQIQDGSVILMHDIYASTVDAVELMIPKLIDNGYELVTIHELAERFDITLEAGVAYNSFK